MIFRNCWCVNNQRGLRIQKRFLDISYRIFKMNLNSQILQTFSDICFGLIIACYNFSIRHKITCQCTHPDASDAYEIDVRSPSQTLSQGKGLFSGRYIILFILHVFQFLPFGKTEDGLSIISPPRQLCL